MNENAVASEAHFAFHAIAGEGIEFVAAEFSLFGRIYHLPDGVVKDVAQFVLQINIVIARIHAVIFVLFLCLWCSRGNR